MNIETEKLIRVKASEDSTRFAISQPIYKEDYGLYLFIEGLDLPEVYTVDFSESETNGTSVSMLGNADGVLIPQQFIKSGKTIYAFLYLVGTGVGTGVGKTVYKFKIPNRIRPDRTNEQPTPEEQSTIDQAISVLNSAVAQTAQDVIDAGDSAQDAKDYAGMAEDAKVDAQNFATQAEQSEQNAYTYALSANGASDTAIQSAELAQASAQTASEKANSILNLTASAQTLPEGSSASASYNAQTGVMSFGIPKGADGTNGTDGTDGDDGISPTVTITPITGGHRITITDADGTETADVMDGHNGMVTVNVTGTTPTITAQADYRYVCGEVATLDFTPSQTGICDVIFTSGSTPTVVTLPSTVKFPDGSFTAEANTTYEINILDGIYGAVMAWT